MSTTTAMITSTTTTLTASMSCPSSGIFYACGEGSRFVGCCNANPCSNGCSDGNLLPASFDTSQYGQISDQECTDGTKRFYTCVSSAFWGCCSVNACQQTGGCPEENLIAQDLSGNEVLARPYLLAVNSSYVTSTATATATASSTPQSSSINAGAIAGGVVGGLAVLAALALGLVWLLRRRKTSRSSQRQSEVQQQPGASMEGTTKQETPGYYHHQPTSPISSPQPPYSPAPPSYISSETRHISHELPGTNTAGRYEMESGQRYHPYRQA